MSRTIRRANARYYIFDWVLWDHEWADGGDGFLYLRDRLIDPHSIEGRRKLANFHSDAGFGDMAHTSPPHWYRRHCNKRFDRHEQQQVHRWQAGLDDDVILTPRVRNASWWW